MKAFIRLQEAIIEGSRDHSILAFRVVLSRQNMAYPSVLAPNPEHFQNDVLREWSPNTDSPSISLVDGQLTTDMYIYRLRPGPESLQLFSFTNKYIGILDCTLGNDYLARPAILLEGTDDHARKFRRCPAAPVLLRVDANASTADQSLQCCALLNSYRDPGTIMLLCSSHCILFVWKLM